MKFQLGEWTVEENANLLFQSDARVRIEKRVMAVLIELIAANGAVVTKDALLKAVWQGAIVSDHSIANAVSDLRRALGDDRRNPRYIETIPKRGYRLLVDVEELRHGENPDTVGARYVSAGAYRTAVAVVGVFLCTAALIVWFWPSRETPPRLLLPNIENATGNPQWDIAGETATELLTVALAGGDYRLIRWRASGLDEGRDEKLLFEEMHLRARDRVLVGRIILDGEEPILTLQLVDWTDRASVWAGAYPLDAARYGALSESIVANIKEPLGLVDPRRAYSAADPVVFEAYWRARYLWNLREHQAILEALRILTNIVEQAPDYAPAHAALADIYAHKTAEELALDRWETYEIAERHLAHALALDPDLSEALVTRAYLSFFRDRDTQAAMLQIDKAIDLRPENAVAWQTKAMIASAAGAFGTSLDAIDQARALDPLSASMLWDQVWFLYIAERYDEALDATVHARRVSAPVEVYEALIHMARGDETAAFEHWLSRARSRGLSVQLAEEIENISRTQGERAALEALAENGLSGGDYTEHPVPLAALLVALNQNDAAVANLIGDRPREKSWWWGWYDVIPAFDAIRDDPQLIAFRDKR